MNVPKNLIPISIGLICLLVLILVIVFVIRKKDNYNLENQNKEENATYTQAYIDPPNLLKLPPYRKLYPPSKQPLNVDTGLPLSMFNGPPTMNAEYTPDLLWCKQHI